MRLQILKILERIDDIAYIAKKFQIMIIQSGEILLSLEV